MVFVCMGEINQCILNCNKF
uniref:Uncharacterized protein n=1 Tax=Rhizophora mucronata TaxID=61149 RepID=A0A2P2Q0A6_RHIMU